MNHYTQFLEESKQRRQAIIDELERRRDEPGIVRILASENGVTTQAIYHMIKMAKKDNGTGKKRGPRKKP